MVVLGLNLNKYTLILGKREDKIRDAVRRRIDGLISLCKNQKNLKRVFPDKNKGHFFDNFGTFSSVF